MFRTLIAMFVAITALAACAPTAPMQGSAVTPIIQGAPGKAVIYIVRTRPDTSNLTGALTLDGQMIGATHEGTYIRVEVAPGRHRISGYAQDSRAVTLETRADRIYFVQHSVAGSWRAQSPHSFFTMLDENRARRAMAGAVNVAG